MYKYTVLCGMLNVSFSRDMKLTEEELYSSLKHLVEEFIKQMMKEEFDELFEREEGKALPVFPVSTLAMVTEEGPFLMQQRFYFVPQLMESLEGEKFSCLAAELRQAFKLSTGEDLEETIFDVPLNLDEIEYFNRMTPKVLAPVDIRSEVHGIFLDAAKSGYARDIKSEEGKVIVAEIFDTITESHERKDCEEALMTRYGLTEAEAKLILYAKQSEMAEVISKVFGVN